MSDTALMTFTSHIRGKNAKVSIYDTHIEWVMEGKMGVARMTGAVLTAGASAKVLGKKGGGTEMIPIKAITSVTTRKDGMRNWAVSIITSGNTLDMRVSKEEAEQVKSNLLRLMTA